MIFDLLEVVEVGLPLSFLFELFLDLAVVGVEFLAAETLRYGFIELHIFMG